MKEEIVELTIVIPCLNEEKTIGTCLKRAKQFSKDTKIETEMIVADNGSTDDSVKIANALGVRVITVSKKGYGNALRAGSLEAKGKYTIIGDADDSYHFDEMYPFIEKLRLGYDLVIGNRLRAKIEKGAMKWSHRYIGTPIISFIGNLKCGTQVNDFNCGLRGYQTKKINELGCSAEGMEYATEMIMKAGKQGLRILEIPINFYRDGRGSPSHLRTVRDGIRHVKQLLK